MTTVRKPAPPRARAILRKLEALAERGIDGEKLAAQRKIERLKAKFDFGAADVAEPGDLFHGTFKKARKAAWVRSFQHGELDIANAVKWSIEAATGIRCVYRKEDLLAEAAPGTASRLAVIAEHIASSFRQLITQYSSVDGINTSDRSAFVVGLYDGMMNTPRDQGQSLPRRPGYNRKVRANKSIPTVAAHVHVHPYTLAFGLGRQIRFSVPLDEITAELENQTQQRLPSKCSEQGE